MGSDHRVHIDGRDLTPQEISAMILTKIRRDAESYLGEPVTEAVITVPAYSVSYTHLGCWPGAWIRKIPGCCSAALSSGTRRWWSRASGSVPVSAAPARQPLSLIHIYGVDCSLLCFTDAFPTPVVFTGEDTALPLSLIHI